MPGSGVARPKTRSHPPLTRLARSSRGLPAWVVAFAVLTASKNNPLYATGTIKFFASDGQVQPYVGAGVGGAWMFSEAQGFGGGLDGSYTTAASWREWGAGSTSG